MTLEDSSLVLGIISGFAIIAISVAGGAWSIANALASSERKMGERMDAAFKEITTEVSGLRNDLTKTMGVSNAIQAVCATKHTGLDSRMDHLEDKVESGLDKMRDEMDLVVKYRVRLQHELDEHVGNPLVHVVKKDRVG